MRTEIKAALVIILFGTLGTVLWGLNERQARWQQTTMTCPECNGTGRVAMETADEN